MRFPFKFIALLSLPALAWADGLADLRTSLRGLDGHAPVQVNVRYSTRNESTTFLRPVVSQGSVELTVKEDASALRIDWPQPDPSRLPGAVQDLEAAKVDQLLNQARVLSTLLEHGQFVREAPDTFEGRPARVLEFSVPGARPELRGFLSRQRATFRIWIGETGQPLGLESLRERQGRHSRLYGNFHDRSLVRTTFAILDQRLVVASQSSEESSYDTGIRSLSRKTLEVSQAPAPRAPQAAERRQQGA